jgi:hypothetical protein
MSAKAGIQFQTATSAPRQNWIPAFAGMTLCLWALLPTLDINAQSAASVI